MSKEHSFKEGQEVASIWWSDGTFFSIGDVTGCDKITVIMEYGQISGVPWFAVWRDGEIVCKHNSIYVCSVALKNE